MKRWLLCVGVAVCFAWCMGTALATAQEAMPSLGFAPATPAANVPEVIVPQAAGSVRVTSAESPAPTVPCNGVTEAAPCSCQGRLEENGPRRPMCDCLQRSLEYVGRPVVNCLNRKGVGCCGTLNDFGCTSGYAQIIFIFGSCREFFGEPCVPPPPGNLCGGLTGCGR